MRSILVSVLLAILAAAMGVNARFGQEKPSILDEVGALSKLPGVPADGRFNQLQASLINALLAAGPACGVATAADEILDRCKQFGCTSTALPLARKLMALEKNFNPFNDGAAPNLCDDAVLPKSPELRCIVPAIDPAAGGKGGISAAEYNAKAAARLQDALAGRVTAAACAGKSLAAGGSTVTATASATATAAPGTETCAPAQTVTRTVTVTVDAATTTADSLSPTDAACPLRKTATVTKTVTVDAPART
ncbi:hypothetical protein H9P43_004345 [Blastocladiella emersonii ATCC 22665]|nr:hypothetical protein H9P43_004345 [Blastocladiella emersonii ATCC 22665]